MRLGGFGVGEEVGESADCKTARRRRIELRQAPMVGGARRCDQLLCPSDRLEVVNPITEERCAGMATYALEQIDVARAVLLREETQKPPES